MCRITIPPNSNEGSWEKLSSYGIDFPRVPGAECGLNARYMVGATRSDKLHSDPFDSIIVVDLHNPDHPDQTWSTSDTIFVGEPIVASNPAGEDHILVLLSDGVEEQTLLHIFEASNISKGPISIVSMPLLPIAFHGEWDSIGLTDELLTVKGNSKVVVTDIKSIAG